MTKKNKIKHRRKYGWICDCGGNLIWKHHQWKGKFRHRVKRVCERCGKVFYLVTHVEQE